MKRPDVPGSQKYDRMWKLIIAIPLLMLMVTHMYSPKIAGGMVYQANEGIDQAPEGIMGYLAGHDEAASTGILEKEKAYYAASIDKTRARLEAFDRLKRADEMINKAGGHRPGLRRLALF